MSSQSPTPTESFLREYLALTDYWEPDAGDTHELLGAREVLTQRKLTVRETKTMEETDKKVLKLVDTLPNDASGWDVQMLRMTAKLIRELQQPKHKAESYPSTSNRAAMSL